MRPAFNYDPKSLPRELKRHYISASENDISLMLKEIHFSKLDDLYSHIPDAIRTHNDPDLPEEMSYEKLADHLFEISRSNQPKLSFLGDGLAQYKIPAIVGHVASNRGLATAYTPYQPERSQGTLMSQWVYQSAMSMLTGFEAINASMYDRSTCLFEALKCAQRLTKNSTTALVSNTIYPGDIAVLETLKQETGLEIEYIPMDPETGKLNLEKVKELAVKIGEKLACIAFPQVNNLGILEEVDALTDLAHSLNVQAIAVIDPMLLATGGLKAPVHFGEKGADMIVGEGQHLAIDPNFGGPGLGVFGIRFNKDTNDKAIRSSAGRYVGRAKDLYGKDCRVMVLSTREQHIKREKATSNICSNEGFIATLAGAGILGRGESGMKKAIAAARKNAVNLTKKMLSVKDMALYYPSSAFFNEITFKVPGSVNKLIAKACKAGIQIGVNVSERIQGADDNALLISCFDIHTDADIEKLVSFFIVEFGAKEGCCCARIPQISPVFMRKEPVGLPEFTTEELKKWYDQLGEQNVSPDHGPYPLGSCTMKYNPWINEYAANLDGFTKTHPESPLCDVQGNLEILYKTQEFFKSIMGLQGVTTQPLAGAQGELIGIKLFQAYHRTNSKHKRDVLLIPRSAHGTNYATATMAGFASGSQKGKKGGLQLIEAEESGQIDFSHLKSLVSEFGDRIAGIMVTNPNTSGVFETRFKEIADLIHSVGGLVYMDGANLNAIAGWVDLGKMGVDAVHSNLHKTFSIPHGGGGPGDAIVAVSEKLVDYLPGVQVRLENGKYETFVTKKSIGSFHRHYGNFAHKVRCYTYLMALGKEGIRRMSAISVLSSRYLFSRLSKLYPALPAKSTDPKMHEFILTLSEETFKKVEEAGIKHALIIARVGKLFLDFGLHAPTVAWPETYGLMVEPTESYSKAELDRFHDVIAQIHNLIEKNPEVLQTVPHFTPVSRVDEVYANQNLEFFETLESLPPVETNLIPVQELNQMAVTEISAKILEAHKKMV